MFYMAQKVSNWNYIYSFVKKNTVNFDQEIYLKNVIKIK